MSAVDHNVKFGSVLLIAIGMFVMRQSTDTIRDSAHILLNTTQNNIILCRCNLTYSYLIVPVAGDFRAIESTHSDELPAVLNDIVSWIMTIDVGSNNITHSTGTYLCMWIESNVCKFSANRPLTNYVAQ